MNSSFNFINRCHFDMQINYVMQLQARTTLDHLYAARHITMITLPVVSKKTRSCAAFKFGWSRCFVYFFGTAAAALGPWQQLCGKPYCAFGNTMQQQNDHSYYYMLYCQLCVLKWAQN